VKWGSRCNGSWNYAGARFGSKSPLPLSTTIAQIRNGNNRESHPLSLQCQTAFKRRTTCLFAGLDSSRSASGTLDGILSDDDDRFLHEQELEAR
jgi:hypothetical protein